MGHTIHVFDGGYRIITDLAEAPLLLERGARLWIDSDSVDPELDAFLEQKLGLHPLAIEDILQDRPTPKIEDYGSYLYLVVHGIVRDRSDPEDLQTRDLDIVLGDRWIFTHHNAPSRVIDAVGADLARNPKTLDRGPAYIAHALLDHLVDLYLPVVEAFDEDVDEVEAAVVADPSRALLERIFRLKRSLQRLRRIAMSQREVLLRLSRGEFDEIPERALPFYRDVYDHFNRVAELADSYRELLSGALDAYLSMISNRMNEVMKALTLVATVMLPLTFIAGVYGMNFEDMPELKWRFGYPFALALMTGTAIAMVVWFRRKKWL